MPFEKFIFPLVLNHLETAGALVTEASQASETLLKWETSVKHYLKDIDTASVVWSPDLPDDPSEMGLILSLFLQSISVFMLLVTLEEVSH